MAVINDFVSEDVHRNAIAAFLPSLMEHFKRDSETAKDGSETQKYDEIVAAYELVETLAQEYDVEHLSAKEVGEMMFLLQGIMFTDALFDYSDETMKAFHAISGKIRSIVDSSLHREGGWMRGAAGRFSIEDTPSAIRFYKGSWGSVGGSYGSREQAKKSGFPGYMINYYIKDPADLIQKPVSIGNSWTEQEGYLWQTTVGSLSETICTSAGCFSDCIKLKTLITGEGMKKGKKIPEIDVFVRGTRFMWFAPGVGLVKLEYNHEEGCVTEVNLTSYSVEEAGNSYLPLALGNVWRYQWTDTYRDYVNREVWRVASKSEDRYRISCFNGVSHFVAQAD
jgi:hypothetical protein